MNNSELDINDYLKEPIQDSVGCRSINLMAFLLRDVTYDQLYSDPFYHTGIRARGTSIFTCALDKIIENAEWLPAKFNLPAYGSEPFDVKELLVSKTNNAALQSIRARLSMSDAPPIILGDFFWKSQDQSIANPDLHFTPEEAVEVAHIVDVLESLHTEHGNRMDHLCVPMLAFQKGPKRGGLDLLQKQDMQDFLGVLGNFRLMDFYTQGGTTTQRQAHRTAKQRHILREFRQEDVEKTRAGNAQRCVNGTCSAGTPEQWCNTTSEGVCSIGSD
jgi:hypothetical protein